MTVKIVVAADQNETSHRLSATLNSQPDLQVVESTTNLTELTETARELQADVVLLNLAVSEKQMFKLILALKEDTPDSKLALLTRNFGEIPVLKALRAGIRGYWLTNIGPVALSYNLKAVAGGQISLSQPALKALSRSHKAVPHAETLTERQEAVLKLVAQGKTNKEIANILQLSEKTVKFHVSLILAKLGVHSRVQAALYLNKTYLN